MKLTRDKFRMGFGGFFVLAGVGMLVATWPELSEAMAKNPFLAGKRPLRWILIAGLWLTVAGVGLLLEFRTDPPPRIDAWEKIRNKDKPTN